MRHKLIALCLLAALLLTMPMMALAQGQTGSVSVALAGKDQPVAGAEISLYYVASVQWDGVNDPVYTYTEAFKNNGAELDDWALAEKLDTFVKNNSVPAQKSVTDSQGRVVFADLPLGLYLVKQTGTVKNFAPCTPFLVTVPSDSVMGVAYDVTASPKTEVEQYADITVKKVWNTDESTKIADSVKIKLLRGDSVVKTATLSQQNDWQVTFYDMPRSDSYSVTEVDVPKGFTATYSQKGYVFTVTNSASLIDAGQLVWPIPVFVIAGLFFITLGVLIVRKKENSNG